MVLPILLIIALGSVDLGRALYAYISVTGAARNGAEYASSSPAAAEDLEGIREAVLSDTGGLHNTSPTNPDVSVATGNDGQGRPYAEVTVSYTFTSLFRLPGLSSSVNLERSVRAMVAE